MPMKTFNPITLKVALKSLLPWCTVCGVFVLLWATAGSLFEIEDEYYWDGGSRWPQPHRHDPLPDDSFFAAFALAGIAALLAQLAITAIARSRRWSQTQFKIRGRIVATCSFVAVALLGFALL